MADSARLQVIRMIDTDATTMAVVMSLLGSDNRSTAEETVTEVTMTDIAGMAGRMTDTRRAVATRRVAGIGTETERETGAETERETGRVAAVGTGSHGIIEMIDTAHPLENTTVVKDIVATPRTAGAIGTETAVGTEAGEEETEETATGTATAIDIEQRD